MIKRTFANLTTRGTTYFKNQMSSPRQMKAMGRVAQLEGLAQDFGDAFEKLDETHGDRRDGKPNDVLGTVYVRSHSGYSKFFDGYAKLKSDGTPKEMRADSNREYPDQNYRFEESFTVESKGDKKTLHFKETFHGVEKGYHGLPYSETKEEWVIFDGPNRVTHKAIEY